MMSRSFRFTLCAFLFAAVLWGSGHAEAATGAPITCLLGPPLEGQLNANTATTEQWDLLPGIGPATAKRIVDYVRKHPLKRTYHLQRVKGIGHKTYDRLKPFLVLDGDTTLHVVVPPANDG